MKQYREEHDIKKINWPSNSPDLHPIENVWGPLKDGVADSGLENIGSSKEAKKIVAETITATWDGLKDLKVQDAHTFMRKLRKCVDAKGGNEFHE